MKIDDRTRVSFTLPPELDDAECLCGLTAESVGMTHYRELWIKRGPKVDFFCVYDYVISNELPDAQVGHLTGWLTLLGVQERFPEFGLKQEH